MALYRYKVVDNLIFKGRYNKPTKGQKYLGAVDDLNSKGKYNYQIMVELENGVVDNFILKGKYNRHQRFAVELKLYLILI